MNTPRSWFTRVSTGGCRNVVVFFPIWRLIPGRLLFLLPDSHFHLFHSVLQRKTLISVFPLGVYSAEQQQEWFTSVSAAVAHSFVNKCHTNVFILTRLKLTSFSVLVFQRCVKSKKDFDVVKTPSWLNSRLCFDVLNLKCILGYKAKISTCWNCF